MDDIRLLNAAAEAGEILLKSGAETYRVENTMQFILEKSEHAKRAEATVIMTGLMASLERDGEPPLSIVRRITNRKMNLRHVMQINNLSRQFCSGAMPLEELEEKLHVISREPEKQYRDVMYVIATAVMAMGFMLFFGGQVKELEIGFFAAIGMALSLYVCERVHMNGYISTVIGSMMLAIVALGCKAMFGLQDANVNAVIIGGIMPLVPGVAITNAARDILQGDYLSSAGRILEAFLSASAIAIGAGIGLLVFGF